jgi:protocatechuate 3,4-dioxygenase beta subunit
MSVIGFGNLPFRELMLPWHRLLWRPHNRRNRSQNQSSRLTLNPVNHCAPDRVCEENMRIPAFLLLAMPLLAVSPQRQSQLPASIEGVVVKAGTNEPIPSATVELTCIAPRMFEGSTRSSQGAISVSVLETGTDGKVLSFTTTTDRTGRFTLRNLPPTTGYQLIAIRQPDFLPAQYGQQVHGVPGHPIDLGDGQQLNDIRIEMTPAASISGRVIDANGQALADIGVELRRPWYLEGWRLIGDWQTTISRVRGVGKTNSAGYTKTNGRGEFRFEGLAPAHYYVRTNPSNDEEATLVHLHAGETVQNLKIPVTLSQPRIVRAMIVQRGTGLPVTSAAVTVVRRDAIPLYQNALRSSPPSKDGLIDILLPSPGDYFLVATQRGSQGLAYGRKLVHVGDLDSPLIQIELAPAFDLVANVALDGAIDDGNAPPIAVNLYPLNAGTPVVAQASLTTLKGGVTIRNVVAGDFRVEVDPILKVPPSSLVSASLQNAYVKSIRLGTADVLNGGLHLESPPNSPLEIVISKRGGTLEGRVLDQKRKLVSNAAVVLVPDMARRKRGDLYKSVLSDDMGRFQLRGLPPGTYKLFAWERVEDGAWHDPEFIKLYEDDGTSVRITEDGRQIMDANLILAWN